MDIIYIIILGIGVFIGIGIRSHIGRDEMAIGVVQIDHETGLCRFLVDKDTLSDIHCRKVVFKVEHDAVIEHEDSQ